VSERVADRITRVDHVAIAVESIADTVPLFRDALGARFLTGGDNDATGIRLVHFQLPGLKLELMAFFVDDVPRTVDLLEGEGIPTTGTDIGTPAWSETFIRPTSSFGALLQFVSSSRAWGVPTSDFELADVLAGRVVWREYIACLRESIDTR